jgi:hypothetical protein
VYQIPNHVDLALWSTHKLIFKLYIMLNNLRFNINYESLSISALLSNEQSFEWPKTSPIREPLKNIQKEKFRLT